jgi:hypothetical protein
MKPNYIIAIDPDVTRSGVAFLETATRKLEVSSFTFPLLLDCLQFVKRERMTAQQQQVMVVVEAGWFLKSNWHLRDKDNIYEASAKGNSNGRNHETGRKIVEMCGHYGIPVTTVKPLKKIWRGKDGKITREELAYFTGMTGRNNQEERDAALIAWVWAGLPIKIKYEKQ